MIPVFAPEGIVNEITFCRLTTPFPVPGPNVFCAQIVALTTSSTFIKEGALSFLQEHV